MARLLGLVLASIAVAFLGKAVIADSKVDRERCGRMANASAQAECYRSLVGRDHIGPKAEYERCLGITPPTGRANCFRALLSEKVRDKAASPPTREAEPPPPPSEVSSPPAAAAPPPPPAPGSPGLVEETVYGFLEHLHLSREGDRTDIGYVVAIALATVVAVAAVVIFTVKWMIHPHRTAGPDNAAVPLLEVDDSTLRDATADLERRLAVEEQKPARHLEIERSVSEKSMLADALREENAEVEQKLVATSEVLNQMKITLGQTQARLSELVLEAKDLDQRYEKLKDVKATLEQTLAARTEALARVEASADDLRVRLAEAENARQETVWRLEASRAEAGELHIKCARLQEALDQVTKQSEEKLALLNEAKDRMTQEVKLFAEEVIKRYGEAFTKQNKEQVDGILAALREKLIEFQQSLHVTHTESAKERTLLAEQIRLLSETSAKMTNKTLNLTRVLKGTSATQGAWGGMVLSTLLERSGLREGEEYITQKGLVAEEGSRLRPDVLVNLPNGERIAIDSKVSLTAFEAYLNCEADAERASHLSSHVSSMRGHIKILSGKECQQISDNGLDYVIMFVPIEGALAAALQEDLALTGFAAEHKVAIATPTTLMIALRTVANVWQVERRHRNAEAIAEQAGRLYDEFVGFLGE